MTCNQIVNTTVQDPPALGAANALDQIWKIPLLSAFTGKIPLVGRIVDE